MLYGVLKPEGTVGQTWYTEKEFLDDYRQRFEEKRLRFAKTAA